MVPVCAAQMRRASPLQDWSPIIPVCTSQDGCTVAGVVADGTGLLGTVDAVVTVARVVTNGAGLFGTVEAEVTVTGVVADSSDLPGTA